MKKRNRLLPMLLAVLLALGGCAFPGGEMSSMLSPPSLSVGREALTRELNSIIGEDYELIAPKSGSYRTAIISKDVNGDEQNEAICFYRASGKIRFLVMENTAESWRCLSGGESEAASIGQVNFGDLTGDGVAEVIVGWQYLTESEGSYDVYSLLKEQATSVQSGLYNHMVVVERENDPDGLVVLNRNTATKAVTASLVRRNDQTISVVNSVAMNERATDYLNILSAETSQGASAVYVDELLENGQVQTEILVINNQGRLTNELFSQLNSATLRNSAIVCRDYDGDGVPEVPVEEALPSYYRNGVEENLFLIQWNTFDGARLSPRSHSFVDITEKFMLNYPAEWYGKITVRRSEKNERAYEFLTMKGKKIFTIQVFGLSEYSETLGNEGWRKLYSDSDHVYVVYCEAKNSYKVDYAKVYSLFTAIV